MRIFNYHPITGALLTVGVADENHLEPDDPIIPGYATPLVPPAVLNGQVAVYRAADGTVPQNWPQGEWTAAPDYRQVSLYRTSDGSPFKIGDEFWGVGDLPTWLTPLPMPSPAHAWNGVAWELDHRRAAEIALEVSREEKAAREAKARTAMEPLQMAVDIGLATEEEAARLLAWKRYFVLLSRVDLASPVWPDEPTE